MSVLIRGMEMPKRGHTTTITIVGSGQAYVEYFDCRPHVKETIEYTAVPVPPHGKLIDADALIEKCEEMADKEDGNQLDALVLLRLFFEQNAPTVIPAEEDEP